MRVIEYADDHTPGANRYGHGYHDLRHKTCPNCETLHAALTVEDVSDTLSTQLRD